MATTASLLTAEEYLLLPDKGQHTDLVLGELVIMNMPGFVHGVVCMNAGGVLREFVKPRQLGRVMTNDVGVVTHRNPDSVRGADVSYYSYARVPRGIPIKGYAPAPPNVVFEVRSPTERWPDLLAKTAEYLDAGVEVVCLVDCDARNVTVYRADRAAEVFTENDELTLPELHAEFRVAVARFFDDL